MMDDAVLFVRNSDEIVSSILNRPEKRNALSIQLMKQLCAHAEEIGKDGKIRIWILRGSGSAFCAGLDVSEARNPDRAVESAGMVRACLSAIYRIPVMTLAMVHGPAMGGGAGIVAACDFAVASAGASIGFPEVRRGMIPAQVLSVLVRKLKRADIRALLLSGESIDAARAQRMGLFNSVGDLEAEADRIIAQLLQAAPGSLAETKQLIDQLYPRPLQDDMEMCLQYHAQAREGGEAQEGFRAFLEKRKPSWHR
jgi:methylglutaconyl-CoA hydratase